MNKHTPGPWEVAYTDKHGQAVVKAEHIEVATCWHHCVGSIEKEMQANARLIAAAPELLEALSEITADYADRFDLDSASTNPGIKSSIKQARDAIVKATGADQ